MFNLPDSDIGCGQSIDDIGLGRLDGQVDHIDNDPYNRDWTNLRLLHTLCHAHVRGGPTLEQRAAISAKLKGRLSPTKGMKFPDRAKQGTAKPKVGAIHASNKGVTRSSELRAKIAQSLQGRKLPDRSGDNHWIRKQGRINNPQHAVRMRERYTCTDCGHVYNKPWLTRHKRENRCIVS